MTEWISVKDTLPHDGQKCLFYTKSDFYLCQIISGVFKIGKFIYIQNSVPDCGCSGINIKDVTHWMSLPEFPNE
jgi:hypothetical protein